MTTELLIKMTHFKDKVECTVNLEGDDLLFLTG